MSDNYYYKCGTHNTTRVVTCIKSSNDYKDFNEPEDYHTIVKLRLEKSFAEKKVPGPVDLYISFFGFLTYTHTQTGEAEVLSKELKTSHYAIINK